MKSTVYRNSKNAGFSLLELLICIVIIVILGSALNPVLTGAKEQANMSKCSGNIRQISIALTSYAANNDDMLPKVNQDDSTWMHAIEGDVKKSREIFKCPSEPDAKRKNIQLGLNEALSSSYGLNLQVAGRDKIVPIDGFILSNIEQPSQTVILTELAKEYPKCYCDPSNTADLGEQVDFTRHGGAKQSIYLFADGHTKAHKREQVLPDDGTYEKSWFNPERE